MRITCSLAVIIYLVSATAAVRGINNWYFPAVISAWVVFLGFNNEQPQFFIKSYSRMFLFGLTIEVVGRYMLRLWHYPYLNTPFKEGLLFLFYPFVLLSFREMYTWLKRVHRTTALFSSMLLGIVLWELPNLYSRDWIYTLPLFNQKVFGLEIAVILGWSILIIGSDLVYGLAEKPVNMHTNPSGQ